MALSARLLSFGILGFLVLGSAATAAELAPITLDEALAQVELPPPAANTAGDSPQTTTLSPEAKPESPWAGTLELYGFAPFRTTTTTTINGFTAEADFSLGQVLRALTSAFSLRGSVEYGRVGLMTDVSYTSVRGVKATALPSERGAIVDLLRLQDRRPLRDKLRDRAGERLDGLRLAALRERLGDRLDGRLRDRLDGRLLERLSSRDRRALQALAGLSNREIDRSLNTTLESQEGLYDIALRYRFGERESAVAWPGAVTVVPYAGVRIVDAGLQITNALQRGSFQLRSRTDSFGQPYAQALFGTWGQVFLTPRLRMFARGDVGTAGSGSGSDLSANAQVGVGYAVGNSTQLDLSWRYLHLDRDNGQSPRSAYLINQNGVELGVKFFF
ncbi:hypothetical protein NZK33_03545 [Cyanobium sp. FGCU-6]|jgi:hypothetical protein|nr:hypothetical protein [Cyanobium sp. FGCU6]